MSSLESLKVFGGLGTGVSVLKSVRFSFLELLLAFLPDAEFELLFDDGLETFGVTVAGAGVGVTGAHWCRSGCH